MKKFLYTGPTSAVSLKDESGQGDELMLFAGVAYDLPPDHPSVERLTALGWLSKVTPAAAVAAEKKESK